MKWYEDYERGSYTTPSFDSERMQIRSVKCRGVPISNGQWVIPSGHGEHSGRVIDSPIFEYAVVDGQTERSYFNDMSSNRFEGYNFAEDDEFAMKYKEFYHLQSRRTGKTHLQARTCIELAIETGKRIYFADHNEAYEQSRRNDQNMRERIQRLICTYYSSVLHGGNINVAQDYVEFRGSMDYRVYNPLRIKSFTPEITTKRIVKPAIYDSMLLICQIHE